MRRSTPQTRADSSPCQAAALAHPPQQHTHNCNSLQQVASGDADAPPNGRADGC